MRCLGWAIAALTFLFHLAYGVWFWTSSPTNAPKTGLGLAGEAYLASYPSWNTDREFDAAAFNRTAQEVLRTGVPRTRSGAVYFHAPAYSYFLAACYGLGGFRLLAVAIPQALLSGLTAWLIGVLAYRLCPQRPTVALGAAALLVLINLRLAALVGYMVPVSPLLFVFALAMLAALRPDSSAAGAVLAGCLLAGVYLQAAFFVVAAAAALWLGWRSYVERRWVQAVYGLVLLLGIAAKVLLSVLHVGMAERDPVREADRGILWEANNPYYESMTLWSLWERRPGNAWTTWTMTDQEKRRYDGYLARAGGDRQQAALLWIRENPGQYVKLCLVRLRTELGPITGQMSPLNKLISAGIWLLVFPAGVLGWWRQRRTPFAVLALLIVLGVFALDTLVLVAWQLRYRLPVDMLLTAYAGVGYAWLWQRVADRAGRRVGDAAAA